MELNPEKLTPPVGKNFPVREGSAPVRDEKLWEVSKGFEALFLQQMYKSMRRTIVHSEYSEPSTGRELFTEMLDEEYAKMAGSDPDKGLAGTIYRYLLREKGENPDFVTPNVHRYVKPYGPVENSSFYQQAGKDSQRWEPYILEASEKYEVDSSLIRSVIHAESSFNPNAVSKAGAKGLMQLMPLTAREMGVKDVFNPRENIHAGVRYLRLLLDKYNGNEKKALAAYNAGPQAVDRFRGIPPYPETRNYVKNVLNNRWKLENQQPRSSHGSND